MYRVVISDQAWTQLGKVPTPVYEGIRNALNAVASQRPDAVARDAQGKPVPSNLIVAEWVAVYEAEPERETIRLVTVSPYRE